MDPHLLGRLRDTPSFRIRRPGLSPCPDLVVGRHPGAVCASTSTLTLAPLTIHLGPTAAVMHVGTLLWGIHRGFAWCDPNQRSASCASPPTCLASEVPGLVIHVVDSSGRYRQPSFRCLPIPIDATKPENSGLLNGKGAKNDTSTQPLWMVVPFPCLSLLHASSPRSFAVVSCV